MYLPPRSLRHSLHRPVTHTPVVKPLAYNDSTISSTPNSRRCRLFTICGSNDPSRSRGTSISTCPVASVSTVFDRVPLRTFAELRSAVARSFSWPRCSVISSFNAVSRTLFVELLQQPLRAGQRQACSLTIRTSSAAASRSVEGLGFFFGLGSLGFTSLSVAVTTAPSRRLTPGVSGRKHH
jgi:hypothetical protein